MPESVTTRDAALSPNVVVAAVVALVAIAAALVVGTLIAGGLDNRSTPIVTSVLGLIAPTIVGLLALVKAEKVDRKTDAVNEKVDGHLSQLAAIATTAAAASGDTRLVQAAGRAADDLKGATS